MNSNSIPKPPNSTTVTTPAKRGFFNSFSNMVFGKSSSPATPNVTSSPSAPSNGLTSTPLAGGRRKRNAKTHKKNKKAKKSRRRH